MPAQLLIRWESRLGPSSRRATCVLRTPHPVLPHRPHVPAAWSHHHHRGRHPGHDDCLRCSRSCCVTAHHETVAVAVHFDRVLPSSPSSLQRPPRVGQSSANSSVFIPLRCTRHIASATTTQPWAIAICHNPSHWPLQTGQLGFLEQNPSVVSHFTAVYVCRPTHTHAQRMQPPVIVPTHAAALCCG